MSAGSNTITSFARSFGVSQRILDQIAVRIDNAQTFSLAMSCRAIQLSSADLPGTGLTDNILVTRTVTVQKNESRFYGSVVVDTQNNPRCGASGGGGSTL